MAILEKQQLRCASAVNASMDRKVKLGLTLVFLLGSQVYTVTSAIVLGSLHFKQVHPSLVRMQSYVSQPSQYLTCVSTGFERVPA